MVTEAFVNQSKTEIQMSTRGGRLKSGLTVGCGMFFILLCKLKNKVKFININSSSLNQRCKKGLKIQCSVKSSTSCQTYETPNFLEKFHLNCGRHGGVK